MSVRVGIKLRLGATARQLAAILSGKRPVISTRGATGTSSKSVMLPLKPAPKVTTNLVVKPYCTVIHIFSTRSK